MHLFATDRLPALSARRIVHHVPRGATVAAASRAMQWAIAAGGI
jgi:hypothetical protein